MLLNLEHRAQVVTAVR